MSSFTRTIHRKILRGKSDYAAEPQPTIMIRDGGYRVLHPTRGWKRVCGKRARLYGGQP